jgi:arylsulfatase A-like enzyme
VLFLNRKLGTASPHIMDLGPTILKVLGVPPPDDIDGKALW